MLPRQLSREPSALFGQAFTGSISGIVTDSTGGVVPGVGIVITDVERNVTFPAISNQQAFYAVISLPPGNYSVAAEKEGFRKFILQSIPLATQQKATVDVVLQLGQVAESIEVTGQTLMSAACCGAAVCPPRRFQQQTGPAAAETDNFAACTVEHARVD